MEERVRPGLLTSRPAVGTVDAVPGPSVTAFIPVLCNQGSLSPPQRGVESQIKRKTLQYLPHLTALKSNIVAPMSSQPQSSPGGYLGISDST